MTGEHPVWCPDALSPNLKVFIIAFLLRDRGEYPGIIIKRLFLNFLFLSSDVQYFFLIVITNQK